ncbi:uncharacterized protein LOC144798641 [Lissotriton helveticus]
MVETSNESSFPPLLSNNQENKMHPGLSVSGKVITAVMSIASISVGSVYFHDCPAQCLIPYYLIISGVSSLLLLIQSIFAWRNQEEPSILNNVLHWFFNIFSLAFYIAVMACFHKFPGGYLILYDLIITGVTSLLRLIKSILCCVKREEPFNWSNICSLIISLFVLAFFIAGNVWIYSIYAPNYTDPTAANYCRKELYLYAFWITNLFYIFLGLFLAIVCVFLGAVCFIEWSFIDF